MHSGKPVLRTPQNITALNVMRDCLAVHKISPDLVTNAIEETTRHIFHNGNAIFMRNWPYAWNIFQKEGSPVKGKIGVSALPHFPGHTSASALGGWQLGINRFSKKKQLAEKLVSYLTSPEIQKQMALTVGYKPTRKQLYKDADLQKAQPFMVMLYDVFLHAKPRPVTPYYMAITQVLQSEFSAAINGIKTADEALQSAQTQLERIVREDTL